MQCNVAIRMLRNISLSSIETFEASLCDIVHHCLTTPASSSHSAQFILSSLVLVSDTSAAAARDIALLCRTYLSYYCYAVLVHITTVEYLLYCHSLLRAYQTSVLCCYQRLASYSTICQIDSVWRRNISAPNLWHTAIVVELSSVLRGRLIAVHTTL